MALVQLSGIISNIKGSIGGTTFSQNRAGTTAKKRITQGRLLNQKQSGALNTAVAVTVAWNALSYSQKNIFNLYALANAFTDRYGVVKQLTGYQWYKMLSQNSQYFTGSQLTSPPTFSIPSALPTFTLYTEHDGLRVQWSTPIDTTDIYVYCYTSAPTKQQARVQRGSYRLTDVRALDTSSFFNITSAWSAAHGIDYLSIAASGNFNISALFFAVKKSSFNTGIAVTASAPLS